MPHYAAFHNGLRCLFRQNRSSEKEIYLFLEIITCVPLLYTMDNTNRIVSNHIVEPVHEIFNNVGCATSKASDQPAHTRSLIRTFAIRFEYFMIVKLLTEHHLEF